MYVISLSDDELDDDVDESDSISEPPDVDQFAEEKSCNKGKKRNFLQP